MSGRHTLAPSTEITVVKLTLMAAVAESDLGQHDQLKRAVADACIRSGLAAVPGGFQIKPVDLAKLGADNVIKQAITLSGLTQKLRAVLALPELSTILTLDVRGTSTATALLQFAELVPDASPHIRSLLPTVQWQTSHQPAVSSHQLAEASQDAEHRPNLRIHRVSDAKLLLKQAITAVSIAKSASLKKAAACVCIDSGLKFIENSFVLTPVLLKDITEDNTFQQAKKACKVYMPEMQLFQLPAFQRFFSLVNENRTKQHTPTVVIKITTWLQDPSQLVKSLLPSETWTQAAHTSADQTTQDSAASSSSESPTSTLEPRASLLSDSSSGRATASPLRTDAQDSESAPEPVRSMLQLLPPVVRDAIQTLLTHTLPDRNLGMTTVTDIVADLGRPVRIRFGHSIGAAAAREVALPVCMDMQEAYALLEAARAADHSGSSRDVFLNNNRIGVSGTLHRISALRNTFGELCGLTYRIGRNIAGVSDVVTDIIARLASEDQTYGSSGSLLLVGPPGVGKTTLLRDITRQLADSFHKVVMVVDPRAEIAGGGHIPHACIGAARRMLGTASQSKYEVLEEAVCNHGPEVIVVDEIGSSKEVAAVKDIAQRGVKMVATVHGTTLQRLLDNSVLNPLLGGKQRMVIGDMAAQWNSGRKTKSERCDLPVFSYIIEIRDRHTWHVHHDAMASVDAILQGRDAPTECRISAG